MLPLSESSSLGLIVIDVPVGGERDLSYVAALRNFASDRFELIGHIAHYLTGL